MTFKINDKVKFIKDFKPHDILTTKEDMNKFVWFIYGLGNDYLILNNPTTSAIIRVSVSDVVLDD